MATELRGKVLTALLVPPSLMVTLWLLMERTDRWTVKVPLPSKSLTFCMLACGVSWETLSLMTTLVTYWGWGRDEAGGGTEGGVDSEHAQFPFQLPFPLT